MWVIDPGHCYKVAHLDGAPGPQQEIRFVKRIGDNYPGNEGEPYAGTNCQELLRVLIDRVKYLNGQKSHAANAGIIRLLRLALNLFEIRAAERRGYRFEHPPEHPETHIERVPFCPKCGHVGCQKHSGIFHKGIYDAN